MFTNNVSHTCNRLFKYILVDLSWSKSATFISLKLTEAYLCCPTCGSDKGPIFVIMTDGMLWLLIYAVVFQY